MPLLWLSLAFVLGILLGEIQDWPFSAWLMLAGACLVLLILQWVLKPKLSIPIPRLLAGLPRPPLPILILLAVLFMGGARMQLAQPPFTPTDLAFYNDLGERTIVEGVLASPPELDDAWISIQMKADSLRLAQPTEGEIAKPVLVEGQMVARVQDAAALDWRYGDRLRLEGWLETPPEFEDFSYKTYLAHQGIYSQFSVSNSWKIAEDQSSRLKGWIWDLRASALQMIYRLFPDPEAALLAGILLGVEGGIPDELVEDFRATGTAHIIAISGFNMAIVAGLFILMFRGLFGPRWGALAAVVGVGIYTILVGASAGVVRAAIMACLGLFAAQVGRRQDGVNSLAIVAALMALVTPYILWDVSFQLSFLATLGLVLFATPMTESYTGFASRYLPEAWVRWSIGPVGAYFLCTIAAQVMVLPLMIYLFHDFSLISVIANPLVLPAQAPLMIMGGLAVLMGLLIQPVGQAVAYVAWPFLAYTIRVVEWLAGAPLANIAFGEVGWVWVGIFYVLVLGVVFGRARFPELVRLWKPSAALLGLAALAVVVWRAALFTPDGLLHLVILDVGINGNSGDALLVRAPSGRSLLIDGGPSPNLLSEALGRRLPFGRSQLDWLVIAGSSEGQTGALPQILERFPPAQILWSGQMTGTESARSLLQRAAEKGIELHQATTGQALNLGQGARLEVLAATVRGAVLLLEWENFRALLPVGLDFETMESLYPGAQTVYLLAENGLASLNTPGWLQKIQPEMVVLSVAAGDRDGLPDPETLEALAGRNLLRTDEHGWIEITTDGEQMWLEVEKK
jgi:competence protein ComEC